jgi:transcriptional regulator with XRE-family HTH domain
MSMATNKKQRIERFGQKLHSLRTQRGLTLKDLASSLGLVAHGYISEIESGKKMPSIEFVLGVARLFQVSTDQLLKDELEVNDLDTSKPKQENP